MPLGRSESGDSGPRRVRLVSTGGRGGRKFDFATPDDRERYEQHRATHPERYVEAELLRKLTRASLDEEVDPSADEPSSQ